MSVNTRATTPSQPDIALRRRILVILPALNEGAGIAMTVGRIRAIMPQADVLVVNDGSRDETGAQAAAAGAIVLHMPYNVGIGAAVQTAFIYADQHGYDVVVRNDGDGQHVPEGIPRLIERLNAGDVDMVIGSRFLSDAARPDGTRSDGDYGTSAARRAGNFILTSLLSLITGQPITDPTSGFNAFNRRAIRLFARVYPHDYPEPESIVVLHRSGLRLTEIPATFRLREHGRSSITATRSAYYMLKVTLAILINLLRTAPRVEVDA